MHRCRRSSPSDSWYAAAALRVPRSPRRRHRPPRPPVRLRAMPRPDLSATRSLAWLYSSAPLRRAITALAALEREVGESLRPGLDHQVAHTRLAWWREECARTVHGGPNHPLTRELSALFAPLGAEALTGLAGLVGITVWDLSCSTFDTRRELTAYCERWSGAVIAPLMRLAVPAH